MVNQHAKRTPAGGRPSGNLPCGECGLPGLAVRPVPVRSEPLQSIPMLICRFCHVGVQVGRVWQMSA